MAQPDQSAASLAEVQAVAAAARKRKPKIGAIEYAQRLAREKAAQQRRYCDAFALWRSCDRRACRRRHACSGDAHACLRGALERVPQPVQWRARQAILAATPRNIGAPERQARHYMPHDFYA